MLHGVIEPKIPFNPPVFECRRAAMAFPGEPDGDITKPFWQGACESDAFFDIEGEMKPRPWKRTRVKMLWDDEYLYIGARLDDDEIWASVSARDELIFVDNDFEVFLAPNDTTHRYFEIEMNALGAVWDLFMPRPQRDMPHRLEGWDIRGLKSAVHIEGELNNPAANNKFWSLELIIPWKPLRECPAGECVVKKLAPAPGDVWRANFSRVEYDVDVCGGKYVKKPALEHNWVWAPTGAIDIHMPEMWGYLWFADGAAEFARPADECIKMQLRRLYYRERNYGAQRGFYTADFRYLQGDDAWTISPSIYTTPDMFEICAEGWAIRQDGYIWRP